MVQGRGGGGAAAAVGDCWKLDVREVMRLRPTLLIGSVPFAAEAVGKILEQPVAFLALNPRTLADIESDILLLGRLVERGRAAERLVRRMRAAFEDVARLRARGGARRLRPRVYCEAWPNPRISSPPWVAELVEIAGGKMVVKAGARVSDEEVARRGRTLLYWLGRLRGPGEGCDGFARSAWRDVPAVRERPRVVVRDEILNTPGPPLILGREGRLTNAGKDLTQRENSGGHAEANAETQGRCSWVDLRAGREDFGVPATARGCV